MKELRSGTFRRLFIFDPQRRAVVLVGGNKVNRWHRWYRENIPVADDRYDRYLAERT